MPRHIPGLSKKDDPEPEPSLRLHLEPDRPIEVVELTGALAALARQYQVFATETRFAKPTDARLLVSSVKPGSIDILLVPDWYVAAGLITPLIDKVEHLAKFGGHLKSLIELFSKKKPQVSLEPLTVKDCEDVTAIVRPIANNGGTQTFNLVKGNLVVNHILTTDADEAMRAVAVATGIKSLLQQSSAERRQRVSMVWKRLDSDRAKIKGTSSPDKALISEIDPEPRAVLFTDEMGYLKDEMIKDEDRPFQKVYFVDVEVSRVGEKVTAYRIVGYHGKDDIESST